MSDALKLAQERIEKMKSISYASKLELECERLATAYITLYADAVRFSNPWTVQIWNHRTVSWAEFCVEAPVTLAEAEDRVDNYAKNPMTRRATFRAVPWLNSSQRQHTQSEAASAKAHAGKQESLQMKISKTAWACEACGGSGVVEHDENAGVYEVVNKLRDAHQASYPNCNNGVAKMRVQEVTGEGTK